MQKKISINKRFFLWWWTLKIKKSSPSFYGAQCVITLLEADRVPYIAFISPVKGDLQRAQRVSTAKQFGFILIGKENLILPAIIKKQRMHLN